MGVSQILTLLANEESGRAFEGIALKRKQSFVRVNSAQELGLEHRGRKV